MRITETKLRIIVRKVLSESTDIHDEQLKQAIIRVVRKYSTDDSGYPCLYESGFDGMHAHVAKELDMSEEEAHGHLDELYEKLWVPNPNFNNLKDTIIFKYLEDYIQGEDRLYYIWEMKVFDALGWDYDEEYERFRKDILNLMGISRLGM